MNEQRDAELYKLVGELRAEVHALREEQRLLRGDVVGLKAQANKWKGAFGVVLMGGGFVGWASSWLWDHMRGVG